MQNDYLDSPTGSTPWYRTRAFRIGLSAVVGLAVIALVLFSRQLGELLNLGGSKAAIESQVITIDGVGDGTAEHFFHTGFSIDPANSLKIEGNRLTINPLNPGQ